MARTLRTYPSVILKSEDLNDKIDFARIFGRASAIHIEIGSGRATFLIKQAMAQPQVDFLGIEWAGRYYRYAVDRIGRWSLSNVRIIRTDAAQFLADFVPSNSIDCFHIYFPDPWPKKRHHKRRFLNPANLEQLLRCLKPEGIIKIATDHAEYFEQIQIVLTANDCLKKIVFLPTAGAVKDELVGTNFERKYIKEKRPIFSLAVMKTKNIVFSQEQNNRSTSSNLEAK